MKEELDTQAYKQAKRAFHKAGEPFDTMAGVLLVAGVGFAAAAFFVGGGLAMWACIGMAVGSFMGAEIAMDMTGIQRVLRRFEGDKTARLPHKEDFLRMPSPNQSVEKHSELSQTSEAKWRNTVNQSSVGLQR